MPHEIEEAYRVMTDGYADAVVEPPTNAQHYEQSRLYNITHAGHTRWKSKWHRIAFAKCRTPK